MSAPKKLHLYSEVSYLVSLILLGLAIAMVTAADFGVSMVVAPAYVLSNKLTFLTFGQCEWVLQAIVFIVFCFVVRRFRIADLVSFLTCVLYGAALDLWRLIIPVLNPSVTAPGSMGMAARVALFLGGMLLTAFSVALSFETYLCPQVYDYFVKAVSAHFHKNRTAFKWIFDVCCLIISITMSLVFFRSLVGIGIGTLVLTACNGPLIGLFSKLLGRFTESRPLLSRLAGFFPE